MSAAQQQEQRRLILLGEIQQRAVEDPLAWWSPANRAQQRAVLCRKPGVIIRGGNRSGKTVAGAVRCCMIAAHREPGRFRRARLIWCLSQELPDASGQVSKPGEPTRPHVQLEAIKRFMPRSNLIGGSWSRSYSMASRTLCLRNGCRVVFKSYDQDPLAFESHQVDHIWCDEEPTRYLTWSSCLARLADVRGTWMMTFTPILSLEGRSQVARTLLRKRRDPDAAIETFKLRSVDNAFLPEGALDMMASEYTSEERRVRLEGEMAELSGLVLSELDYDRHIIAPFAPPLDWRWRLMIDPGYRNPTAALWFARDRESISYLVDEHYRALWRPEQHIQMLHAQWQMLGGPDVDVIMDPAAFNLHNTSVGQETPSDAEEFTLAALSIGASWFVPRPGNNGDPGALRVKRALAADRLMICDHCKSWLWEAENWSYKVQRSGLAGLENAAPEHPSDADNHCMDVTRYYFNEDDVALREKPVESPRAARAATRAYERFQQSKHGYE